jgi:hypothetical protein
VSKYADDYWRKQAAPRVAALIAAHVGMSESALLLQLRGARASHHYAVNADAQRAWDAEVKAQMAARRGAKAKQPEAVTGNLFGEER